ncbi:TetR family transcriptional regulator [Streptomyces sp. SID8382]|nr:TetR/AcrR family transcriptional regulator [Streptomyces sp. SID8382]MYX60290.1 TetR family transcriptional regulator [Streptomyces sp. SID8382]QDL74618.1 TetR/AcrR family transcriptional regulator [Streptomyces malaysiensis]
MYGTSRRRYDRVNRASDTRRCDGLPPRARRYDAEGTRSALLGAAALRFARYGYDRSSVRDIAKDAGVDAALVYRYFGSKEALFDAVSAGTGLFEPLRHLPLDEVSAWLCDVVSNGPTEEEAPHPLLTKLRSSSREETVGRLREEVTEVFSQGFARRLEGEDAELRAELLAAWLMGITLLRLAIRSPALAATPDDTLLRFLRAGIDPLLDAGCPGGGGEDS